MSNHEGFVSSTGSVAMQLQRRLGGLKTRPQQSWWSRWLGKPQISMGYRGDLGSNLIISPSLYGKVFRADLSRLHPEQRFTLRNLLAQNVDVTKLVSPFFGEVVDYGLLSTKVITDAGVTFLASAFNNNTTNIGTFKYHGFGTGTGAESASDTALGTELTTQYAVDNTRPTGSQSSSTNVYTTVGTLSPDSGGTIAITEHGVFSASSGPTLWDRSKFAAINLVAGSDSLQVTYNGTFSSGG